MHSNTLSHTVADDSRNVFVKQQCADADFKSLFCFVYSNSLLLFSDVVFESNARFETASSHFFSLGPFRFRSQKVSAHY